MTTLKTCSFDSAGAGGNPAVTTLPPAHCDIKHVQFEPCAHVGLFDCMFQRCCGNKHNITVRDVFDCVISAIALFQSHHYP